MGKQREYNWKPSGQRAFVSAENYFFSFHYNRAFDEPGILGIAKVKNPDDDCRADSSYNEFLRRERQRLYFDIAFPRHGDFLTVVYIYYLHDEIGTALNKRCELYFNCPILIGCFYYLDGLPV